MNERIQELANQAYGITDAKPFHPSALIHLEKFAELIINECISAVEDTNDRHRRDYFAAKIREHFGIQE